MPVLETRFNPLAPESKEQRAQLLEQLEMVRDLEERVCQNSARKKAKFEKRGQLLPRERLSALLDPGRPFMELSTLAGLRMHDDDGKKNVTGGGCITGIGWVSGVRCVISASDSAIQGGSISPMGLKKSLRAQEVALENKLPMINLVESGGANLLHQAELFVEGGKIFRNMARLSAAGVPQITVVHGSSTAGGAYIPGLSDYVIVVKKRARIFLAGPPLVKAALGEDADEETLGGAEMHATVTGTAEYLAESDAHALELAREVVDQLGWVHPSSDSEAREPLYSSEELLGLVPTDHRKPYDAREVIARLTDGSEFLEFKQGYGSTTICGHARIEGHRLGIIANNGPIYASGASKAAHFIQACCQARLPLLYLHNITGYMVGTEAEQQGIVKHGAKMIQAVSNATVPQISLVIGGSFGAGNYGMCGRAYEPSFLFSWPNARVSVMGGEQAARVMEIVLLQQLSGTLKKMGVESSAENLDTLREVLHLGSEAARERLSASGLPIHPMGLEIFAQGVREKFKKMGFDLAPDPERGILAQLEASICGQFDRESTALFGTARLWDDGIIDPRDSRRVLGICLSICEERRWREQRGASNTFGVARM